ncbi:hypothetical protein A0H81_11894 [Grifola frondosa]|uniref:Uncharacterized protein n=1 Tax=Grifola frondosa TaxID=5627 RepID=A0A1C7LU44_GRIFR|nr:hypothetical protein A0H81_11894 [Grifola frondosa]
MTPTSTIETANPPTPVLALAGELTAAAHGQKAKSSPQSTAGMLELWPNSAVMARNVYGGEWHAQNPGTSKDQFNVHWKGLSAMQQDAYKAWKKFTTVVTPPNALAMATTSTPQDDGLSVLAAS